MMSEPVTRPHTPQATAASTGGRLVAVDGRTLALQGTKIASDARGGVARVVVEQRFINRFDAPLDVTYSFPLPADGAVSGFAFRVGGRRIVGEIDRRAAARERFERALSEGRSASLLEQDRTSLFTQEIGNIPPGAEVIAEIVIDQRLRWLDEGAWEWRFPTAAAPRYLGKTGRVTDAPRVAIDVAERPLGVAFEIAMRIRDALTTGRRPESPSHRLRSEPADGLHGFDVALDEANPAALDRDVVVRWPVARAQVGLSLDACRPAAGMPHADASFGVLSIVPPSATARPRSLARDVIVLLDTSGSMAGEPLAQAQRVVCAIIDTLGDRDRLELIEFSSDARRWKPVAVSVTPAHRAQAIAWVRSLRASGGTEMREGIYEALRPLGSEAQRQVVLVTDGLIGFESEVVAAVATRLPPGCRVHTVGVGSSVNRSLTSPIARAGHGVEVVLGLGEDPERAARRIVLRTDAPLVVDLSLDGSALLEHAPRCLPDLFASAPALVAVKLRPEGGELIVRGRTDAGAWEERVTVPAIAEGAGASSATRIFARELVEDLEVEVAAGGDRTSLDASIEAVGVDFQIATRLTSWVAIGDVASGGLGKRHHQRVPQEIPHGMSVQGLGLRSPSPAFAASAPMYARAMPAPPPMSAMPSPASPSYYDGGDMVGDDDDKSIVGKDESVMPRVSRRPAGGPVVSGSEPPDGEEKTRVTTVVQRYKKTEEEGGPSTDFLVIIYTKEPTLLGKRFALSDSELRVGRGAENDVVLDGDSVSRRHARFEKKGARWMCVDEGSTNGTYVGDDQIARERALANGDRIKVGGTIFKYLSGADVEAQYHEEIYRMSIIDGLTQAYVKRYVLEALDKEILRARRHTRDLAVLMMDIDHFKNVNDQHGHLAGDYILKEVAKVVLDRIRKDEVFARYGGEEFCMVLPETSAENAAHLAEELRQKIAAATFTFQNEQIKVTISIGVAALPAGEALATQSGQDLVRRADAKLYEAK
ncbi:MAG: hypothetical protein JWM74_1924, partial [Myxococcaceae bacterium]|nr:hypothetical protein [Myxococcaceae bacterium]